MSKHKYGFDKILGQDRICSALCKEVQQGQLAHAILLRGAEGSGRHSLAMALAKYLLCENPGPKDACHCCPSCNYFEAATHPDFHSLISEEGKDIKVEKVRCELVADIHHLPQIAQRKVYLLEADYLNESGQNALLKSLEEPPAYVHFLLTVEEPEKLLPTVLSRVSELSVKAISPAALKQVLAEVETLPSAEIDFISRYAQGNPGRALSLAASEDFLDLRREVIQRFLLLPQKNFLALAADDHKFLMQEKDRFEQISDILLSLLRDVALIASGEMAHVLNRDKVEELTALTHQLYSAQKGDARTQKARCLALLEGLMQAEKQLREIRKALNFNANFEIMSWSLLQNLKLVLNTD